MVAQGGFIDEDLYIGNGGIEIAGIRDFAEFLYGDTPSNPLSQNNVFELDTEGAVPYDRAVYVEGRVRNAPCLLRGNKLLPLENAFFFWCEVLKRDSELPGILSLWQLIRDNHKEDPDFKSVVDSQMTATLEAMILDGWVKASYNPELPLIPVGFRHSHHMKVESKGSDPVKP